MKILILLISLFSAGWVIERTTRENSNISFEKYLMSNDINIAFTRYGIDEKHPLFLNIDSIKSSYFEIASRINKDKKLSKSIIASYNNAASKFIADIQNKPFIKNESYAIDPENLLFDYQLYESLDFSYQQQYLKNLDETISYFISKQNKKLKFTDYYSRFPLPFSLKKVRFNGQDFYGLECPIRFIIDGKEIPKEGLAIPNDQLHSVKVEYTKQ